MSIFERLQVDLLRVIPPGDVVSYKAVDSILLTPIKVIASGQAQQERHQCQPSAAPLKEHPLVVVVTAAGRLLRALHRSYRFSICVSICERARHFIQGGRRACAINAVSRSINNGHHTDSHPPTPASSCSDVGRVLRRRVPRGRIFPPPPLPPPIVVRTAPAISMGALGVIKQLPYTPTIPHTRIRICEDSVYKIVIVPIHSTRTFTLLFIR